MTDEYDEINREVLAEELSALGLNDSSIESIFDSYELNEIPEIIESIEEYQSLTDRDSLIAYASFLEEIGAEGDIWDDFREAYAGTVGI